MNVTRICCRCNNQFEVPETTRNKSICKICYNKMYRDKYNNKKAQVKEQNELEIKKKAVKECDKLIEENKELKEKILQLEEKILLSDEKKFQLEKEINAIKSFEFEEHNKLIEEHNKMLEEHRKLKECAKLIQIALRRHKDLL